MFEHTFHLHILLCVYVSPWVSLFGFVCIHGAFNVPRNIVKIVTVSIRDIKSGVTKHVVRLCITVAFPISPKLTL